MLRTLYKLSLAASLSCGLFAPPVHAVDAGLVQLIENARYWEQNGRGDLARAALEKRLRVEPDNASVYYQLGMTSIRMGEAYRCSSVISRMRERLPQHELTMALMQECRAATRLRVEMAKLQILKDAERFDEAFALIQQMYPAGPPPGRLGVEYLKLEQRARGYLSTGRTAVARFARKYPEDLDYQLVYAELLAGSPRTAHTAHSILRTLITRTNIERKAVLEIWEAALERLGPERVTERMLAEYLRYDPENRQVRELQYSRLRQTAREAAGIALRASGIPSAAVVNQLRAAVRRFPADPWLRYDLIRLLLRRGLQNEAVDQLRDGLRASPQDANMLQITAQVYDQLGMSREALTQLGRISPESQTTGSELRLLRLQAQQHVRQGHLAAARKAYSVLLANPGVQAGDYRDYADFLDTSSDSVPGLRVLRQGVLRFPEDVWLRYQLARRYLDDGQRDRAVAMMIDVVDAAGATPASLYALALVQDAAGRPLAALQSLASIPGRLREQSHREMLNRLRFERCLDVADGRTALAYCTPYARDVWERRRRIALRLHRLGDTDAGWSGFVAWADTQPQTLDGLLIQLELALDMGLQTQAATLLGAVQQVNAMRSINDDGAPDSYRRRFLVLEIRDLLSRERKLQERKQLASKTRTLQQYSVGDLATADELRVLVQALRTLGQDSQALVTLARLVKLKDARDSDYLPYVDILIARGDFEQAETVLEARWRAATAETRVALAQRWRRINPEEAMSRLETLTESQGDSVDVLMAIARYRTEAGEYRAAEANYLSALDQASRQTQRDEIQQALRSLRDRRRHGIAAGGEFVRLPGTPGISQVDLEQYSLELQLAPGWVNSAYLKLDSTVLSAGQLAPDDADEYAQYATVSAEERQRILLAGRKRAQGVALGLGAQGRHWGADIGVTPLGFAKEQWVAGVSYTTARAGHDYRLGLSRRALTSTYLSYSGDRDPVSGEFWGAPLAQGIQLNMARYAARYSYSLSADWHQVEGENVAENAGLVSRAEADYKLVDRPGLELSVGIGFSYWAYQNNLRYYTFGHAGYYSPQSYRNVALPVEIRGLLTPRWSYQLLGRVGYSHSREDAADFYPQRPDLQERARSQGQEPVYPGGSSSGRSFSWRVATEYQFARNWVVGASYAQDRSAFYEPDFLQFYLRRRFSDSRSPLYVPPRPVRAYH